MTFIFALQIKSLDEQSVVGKISKQWSGLVREAFTDADNFGIQFPLDLDVKMKAVMLGACFLIVSQFPWSSLSMAFLVSFRNHSPNFVFQNGV